MHIAESQGAIVLLAWEGKQDFAKLIDCTATLGAACFLPCSGLLCRAWLSRNQYLYAHAANFNLGNTLGNLGDVSGAESGRFQGLLAALPPPESLVAGV
jgi:hypothetical protein